MVPLGIKSVLIFAKFLGSVGLAVVALSTAFILFYSLALFYFCYRLIWFFSAEGSVFRIEKKFQRYIEKLLKDGLWRRDKLSRTVDERNIERLVTLVDEEIKIRKAYLNPAIVQDLKNFLIRCRYTNEFNRVLLVHNTVVNTEINSLNTSLAGLLDDN